MPGIEEVLPLEWATTALGDICDKPEYGWTTKAVNDGSGPKLLRTTDISKGTLNWSTVPFCDQKPHLWKNTFSKEEILLFLGQGP